MKKRIFALLLCAVMLCISLCSCTNTGIKFIQQKNEIHLNYNNVSAGNSSIWIDNEGVYYSNDLNLRAIGQDGMEILNSEVWGVSDIQRHGDKLYYYEGRTVDDEFHIYLVEYDLNVKKVTLEIYLYNDEEAISETGLIILDGYGYYSTIDNTFMRIRLNKGAVPETVATSVFSYGSADGKVRYIIRTGFTYDIYEYDGESLKIGSFEYITYPGEVIESLVNFTNDRVIFSQYGDVSRFIIYHIGSGTVNTVDVEFEYYQAVAFENYMFISNAYSVDDGLAANRTDIYRLCFEDGSVENIYSGDSWLDIFVTSDEDFYVYVYGALGLKHVGIDGKAEDVLDYNPIFALLYDF